MNSRSSVNESNLVNFSADIATLNQLDTKESLLSFPFDHLYACHSESSDRTLQLDKEVEITTHCVVNENKDLLISTSSEISRLTDRLSVTETQNKRLKDLLIYHLDLIQQQNELMTKKEKSYQALKQENDTLKSKLNRMEGKTTAKVAPHKSSANLLPLVNVPTPPVTSTVVKNEPGPSSQILFNSFTELLIPENRTSSYIFNNDLNKSKNFGPEPFDLLRNSDTDVTDYMSSDLGVPSILDNNLNCGGFKMIDNKRFSLIKNEIKTENRPEPLYTITSNSGNPVIQKIQRNRRRTSCIGALSRMSKTPATRVDTATTNKVIEDKSYDDTYGINKKSKMFNTYGKSRGSILKRTSQFTGSLSDRLQLIDTTPTGEDPYQLGEADMREQSPIPKLMLQKSHRVKICTDTKAESSTPTKRIYDPVTEKSSRTTNKLKVDPYNLSTAFVRGVNADKDRSKTMIVQEPDLNLVKTETEIDWRIYNPNDRGGNETSLCDFSYGENPNNLTSHILPGLEDVEFQDFFSSESPLNFDSLNVVDYSLPSEKSSVDKNKRKGARTTNFIGPNALILGSKPVSLNSDAISVTSNTANLGTNQLNTEIKRGTESKRGRKRALSTTGLTKGAKNSQKSTGPKTKITKGKVSCRGKKSPVPGMTTKKPYHTLVGDPDLSWYLGLDPDLKPEDIDPPTDSKMSTVEVPRWREKPYTSCHKFQGTENLDDKTFEKRHQKLEAEERRQLRWHMRRVREQRHVERLRQRQKDSWYGGRSSPAQQPPVYTIWPQPQKDAQVIEITDTLPVMAFGEILPELPESEFKLPWVRTSKALKRSKRSKTLH